MARIKLTPLVNYCLTEQELVLNGDVYKRIFADKKHEYGNENVRYYINKKGVILNVNPRKDAYCKLKGTIDYSSPRPMYRVQLVTKSKKRAVERVSRLMVKAFYPNMKGRVSIQYIDGDTLNVSLDNLNIVTSEKLSKFQKPKMSTKTLELGDVLLHETSIKHVYVGLNNEHIIYDNINKRVIKPTTDRDGYYEYIFKMNNKKYCVYEHQLVYSSYYEDIDSILGCSDLVCDHIDMNRTNNVPDNLQLIPRGINTSFFEV